MLSYLRWLPGLLFFFLSFIILSFCLLFFSNNTTYKIIRVLFYWQLRIFGGKLRISGDKQDFGKRNYLVVVNHQSSFDPFAIAPAIPFRMIALEAIEHFSFPFWGYLIRKWGNIPIDRENRNEAIEKLKSAVKLVETGESIIVFPEGHRTRDGEIQNFKKGPFHLAREVKVPIIPMRIKGLFEFNPKGSLKLKPGIIKVIVGKPIEVNEYINMSVEEIREYVRSAMLRLE